MKYTVIWLPPTEALLAEIWMAASDRKAVTEAAHRLETQLAFQPLETGESRSDEERIAFERPLAIFFRVTPADMKVEVFSLRATHR